MQKVLLQKLHNQSVLRELYGGILSEIAFALNFMSFLSISCLKTRCGSVTLVEVSASVRTANCIEMSNILMICKLDMSVMSFTNQ